MNNFFVIANADKDTDFELTRTVCDFLIIHFYSVLSF